MKIDYQSLVYVLCVVQSDLSGIVVCAVCATVICSLWNGLENASPFP